MRCDNPLKIINKYTGQPMTVGCRHCDSCLIASANAKALLLNNELSKNWISLFITLTYDNAHLPVIFSGDNTIYRCLDGVNLTAIDKAEETFELSPREPRKYPYCDCTGIIYYRDFQNFFKRLRINLNRDGYDRYFKYFIECEYGTVHKRPHAHVILFFEPGIFKHPIDQLICKSWKMCSETVLRNGFKTANKGASGYLASYVNSNSRSYRLATYKPFRQRCRRSNSVDYGCSAKDIEEIKRVIKDGLFTYSSGDDKRPFVYIDTSRQGRFSTCFVSQRVFNTYFPKCHGYHYLSAHTFCLRAKSIRYFCTRIKGRLDNLPFSYSIDGAFKEQDFTFYRGYLRFLSLMSFDDDDAVFDYYIFLHIRLSALYAAQLNRNYMMTFESLTSHDYYFQAYNTESRIPGNSDNFWKQNVIAYDLDLNKPYSVNNLHEMKDYRVSYYKRLLPKHRNSLYNVNF